MIKLYQVIAFVIRDADQAGSFVINVLLIICTLWYRFLRTTPYPASGIGYDAMHKRNMKLLAER